MSIARYDNMLPELCAAVRIRRFLSMKCHADSMETDNGMLRLHASWHGKGSAREEKNDAEQQ